MANIKFSQFTEQTDTANVQFLVGYNGSTNVRIAPGNVSSLGGSGTLNTIAMFTPDGNTLGNSLITITNIGTASESINSTSKILQVGPVTGTKTVAQINLLSGAGNNGIIDAGLGSLLLRINSSSTAQLELATTGALQAKSYGSGTFTGTAAYGLSVDSSGNIIETTAGGGVTSLNDLSDVLIDTLSEYVGTIPAGLSGNPQGNTTLGINNGSALTSGTSNTIIGSEAGRFITSGGSNVVIGQNAGINISNKSFNVVIGKEAGASGTANSSMAIGRLAGLSGDFSVSIGDQASRFANGVDNIFIGDQAGYSSQGGDGVIGIGKSALRANTATGTISLGYQAGYTQSSGNYNTNLGYKAGYTNSTGSSNTHLGYEAGLANTATGNTSIGHKAAHANVTGGYSVNIGFEAGRSQTNNNQNVNIGYGANKDANARNKTGVVAIGMSAMTNGSAGDNNIAIGKNASFGASGSGGNNICIGYNSSYSSATVGNEITLGDANITSFRIPGLQSSASDGDVLTFSSSSGNITLQAAGGGGYPFLIDTASLYSGFVPSSLSGNPQNNTILGISAGLDLTTGTQNTLIGNLAGENVTAQFGTTAVGYKAGSSQNAESFNTYIGNEAGRDHVGSQSVFVGGGTRVFSSGQSSNGVVTVGYSAHDQKAGTYSVAVGYGAGNQASGANSVYIGKDAGKANASSGIIAIGYESGRSNTGNGRIDLGYRAGYTNSSGNWNINLGYFAAYTNSTGSENTVIGTEAGYNNTGSSNTFLGYQAGYDQTTGSNNIVIGHDAEPSAVGVSNEITLGDANITALRIPGLQSGASNGDVLTYASGTGLITLQAAGGGGGVGGSIANTQVAFGNASSEITGDADFNFNVSTNTLRVGVDQDYNGGIIAMAMTADTITCNGDITLGQYVYHLSDTNTKFGFPAVDTFTIDTNGSERMRVASTGAVQLNTYGSGTFTGTAAYALSVDSSGNIIETTAGGGGAAYPFSTDGVNSLYSGFVPTGTLTGTENTILGIDAGASTSSNDDNTLIGYKAGFSGAVGFTANTVVGSEAFDAATSCTYNTVVGYQAGSSATTSVSYATFIGNQAGFTAASNTGPTAIGSGVMQNASATFSTGVGYNAFRTATNIFTTAVGANAAYAGGGNYGAHVGYNAGRNITGQNNTCIGREAGNNGTAITTGSQNTIIGALVSTSAAALSNATAVGYAAADNGNNTVTLGNTFITGLHCQVQTISALSDSRDKTNIQKSSYGLDVIKKLNPVTFEWDQRDGGRKGLKDLGFIAQELQESDDEYLQLVNSNDPEKLQASYGRLIPVMIKAIQELQEEIKYLKNK